MGYFTLSGLRTCLGWSAFLFLGSVLAIVVMDLVTGQINTAGLLAHKTDGSAGVSSGRVQLLISTLAVSIFYLNAIVHARGASALPHVPSGMLEIAAGSQTLYLSGKAWRVVTKRFRNLSR